MPKPKPKTKLDKAVDKSVERMKENQQTKKTAPLSSRSEKEQELEKVLSATEQEMAERANVDRILKQGMSDQGIVNREQAKQAIKRVGKRAKAFAGGFVKGMKQPAEGILAGGKKVAAGLKEGGKAFMKDIED
jgi:hypothetical protein